MLVIDDDELEINDDDLPIDWPACLDGCGWVMLVVVAAILVCLVKYL